MQIRVRYYDGIHNIAHDALLLYHDEQHIQVMYQQQKKIYALNECDYIASVGDILPCLDLPHDARIEFLSQDIPDWLKLKHKSMLARVHHIEQSWRWLFISFVGVIIIVFSTFKWGIPMAAHTIAMNLPEDTLMDLGHQAEEIIIKRYTSPSQLSAQRQQEIIQLYQRLNYSRPAKIIFRQGTFIGANALAIPNHTIIITDELVELTKHDYELLAVLAHEQGHLDERHSLQKVLRALGVSIFYMVITGDGSDLIANFPVIMISAQYSQKFELDADQKSIDDLKRLGISPQYLADFLQRLGDKHHGEESSIVDIFSSHPTTSKRIEQVQRQLP